MKKIRLLTASLTLALLAGCTGTTPTDTPNPATAGGDMVYQVIGVTRDTPLLMVDGAEVSAEKVLFWMTQAVETWVGTYGVSLEEDWDQPYTTGSDTTIADAIKADALSTIEYFQVIENKALEAGVTLSAEQEANMAADLAQAIENSGGEEAFQARLDELCISRAGFEALNRVSYLNEAIQQKLAADGKLDESYTMDDFLEEYGIYAAKHILISTRRVSEDGLSYEEYSDEEKAQAKAQADDLRTQLTASGDSAALFDELMNQYSEDGRDGNGDLYYPQGYTYVYSGQMVSEFEEGAKALAVGEISQPIQSQFGYHIILRIDVDTTGQAVSDMLSVMGQTWLDEVTVVTTPAYDELNVKEFYQKLQEVRVALAPAETADPDATPTPVG